MAVITLQNNKIFDLSAHFPETSYPVGVACTGGIESTILLYLLLQMYGAQNVHVCTGVIHGRREWEAPKAVQMASRLGAIHVHQFDDNFFAMGPDEQLRMRKAARDEYDVINYYIGESPMHYALNHTTPQVEAVSRVNVNHFLPFISTGFTKRDVIDLYYQLGVSDLLQHTYSCTAQGDIHCGECYCCLERVRGFDELGVQDPTTYAIDRALIVAECANPERIKQNPL